ncbi:MAG: DUF4097 domain-containing protein [Candidatus Riflebacteria bacterium]|nr:DUF4097 domain-containing protein [Candidatus Riflebacteria bacterium]
MSEARKKILQMLAEGKISVEQSEELLAALEKDTKASDHKRSFTEEVSRFAENFQKQVREAVKKAEPPGHEFKARIKEFGGWVQNMMGSMVAEFGHGRGEPVDGVSVEFSVPEPDGFSRCRTCQVENLFGSVTIREGTAFALRVMGRISHAALAGQPPNLWFGQHGLRIEGDTLHLGFDRATPTRAVLDLELTLPTSLALRCRSVSASLSIKGPFRVESLKTVSGDIHLHGAELAGASLETVSGDFFVEGGSVAADGVSTSGDFRCKGARIGRLKMQSISGDIELARPEVTEATEVSCNTTSGDVFVGQVQGPWSSVEAGSRTGTVKVTWEGTAHPGLRHGTKLESGHAGAVFTAESVSGDIEFV